MGAKLTSFSVGDPMDLLKILKQANEEFPATRVFWIAIAMVTVITIIAAIQQGAAWLILGFLFVSVCLILFPVLAYFSVGPGLDHFIVRNTASSVLMFYSVLVCLVSTLLVTSFFGDWPVGFRDLVARLNPQPFVVEVGQQDDQPPPVVEEFREPETVIIPSVNSNSLAPKNSRLVVRLGISNQRERLISCLDEVDREYPNISNLEYEVRARICSEETK